MSAPGGSEKQPEPGRPRLPRPSLAQTAALVGLIGGIVGLVFLFKPGWKPAPRADVGKLTIRENSIRASPGTRPPGACSKTSFPQPDCTSSSPINCRPLTATSLKRFFSPTFSRS